MKRLSLNIVLLASLVASAAAQSGSNVTAYYTDYNVTENNWDYHAKPVFCAAVDGDKPLEWRSQFGWTGYCGSNGPQGEEACGKCLSVTNTKTGANETVRIVDTCGSGELELDLDTAFKSIDTDGTGFSQGHLNVDYHFVDCDPVPPPPAGPGESNVKAYWTEYNATNNNWDYYAKPVYCAAVDGGKPLEWRSKYGWTGFCGKVGPQGEEACGKCLKVTNRGTKAEEIVRIVDTCGTGPLEIDLDAFNKLDTDGTGHDLGHLMVDYEIVDCGDTSQENTVLVFSE